MQPMNKNDQLSEVYYRKHGIMKGIESVDMPEDEKMIKRKELIQETTDRIRDELAYKDAE